jgi:hypothetical protein
VAELVGLNVMGGLGGEVLRRFAGTRGEPETRRLLDVLLNVAPGFIQCMAALTDRWLAGPRSATSGSVGSPAFSVGGSADSCYMWRSEGALLQVRGRFLDEDPDD